MLSVKACWNVFDWKGGARHNPAGVFSPNVNALWWESQSGVAGLLSHSDSTGKRDSNQTKPTMDDIQSCTQNVKSIILRAPNGASTRTVESSQQVSPFISILFHSNGLSVYSEVRLRTIC